MKFLLALPLLFLSITINAQGIDTTSAAFKSLYFERDKVMPIYESKAFYPGTEYTVIKQLQNTINFPKYYIQRKAVVKLEITCLISDEGNVLEVGTKALNVVFANNNKPDGQEEKQGLYSIRNQIKAILISWDKAFTPARLVRNNTTDLYTFEAEFTCKDGGKFKVNKSTLEKPADFISLDVTPVFGRKTNKALSDSINNYVRPPALLTYHSLRWNGFVCVDKDGNAFDFLWYKPLLVLHGSYDTPVRGTPEYAAYNKWAEDVRNYIVKTKGWTAGSINGLATAKKVYVSLCVGSNCD